MGSRWERQKALLQVAQPTVDARAGLPLLLAEDEEEEWLERGMMVLFVKQVHLQKEGGAGGVSVRINSNASQSESCNLHAASVDTMSTKSASMILRRFMAMMELESLAFRSLWSLIG